MSNGFKLAARLTEEGHSIFASFLLQMRLASGDRMPRRLPADAVRPP